MGKDGKRVAAVEVMLNTPHIAELVKKGDVVSIKEAIVQSGERGHPELRRRAARACTSENRIELEEALAQRGFAHQPRSQDQFRLSSTRRRLSLPALPARRAPLLTALQERVDLSAAAIACGLASAAAKTV